MKLWGKTKETTKKEAHSNTHPLNTHICTNKPDFTFASSNNGKEFSKLQMSCKFPSGTEGWESGAKIRFSHSEMRKRETPR